MPDTTAPVVSSFSVTNKRFRVGSGATAVTARAKKGTRFKFTLSEDATAMIVIDKLSAGRRVGKRCVRPTRKNRKRKKCTRTSRVRPPLVRAGLKAGAVSVAFSGRLGTKKLRPGSYRATVVAADAAANVSTARRVKFRVVRR